MFNSFQVDQAYTKKCSNKKVKSDKRYNLTEKQNLIELVPSGLSEML